MAPTSATRTITPPQRPGAQSVSCQAVPTDLASLGANSQRREIQTLIREAIRRGKIRALPVPGCPDRVTIVSVSDDARGES